MDKTVELRPAFEWTCEECGRDQFAKCIVPEMSEEDRADLAEQIGEDPVDGEFLCAPEQVTCAFCGQQFTTVDMMRTEI